MTDRASLIPLLAIAVAVCLSEMAAPEDDTSKHDRGAVDHRSGALSTNGVAREVQQLKLALELSDGSRIIGKPVTNSIPFKTTYGAIDVALALVDVVEFPEDCEVVSIRFWNEDKLRGTVGTKEIELDTLLGRHSVTIEHVRSLEVLLGVAMPTSMLKGLLLRYSFDRDEKGKVTDKSGKGNHGTVHGASWTSKGKVGGAYEFDGDEDYIEAANEHAFDFDRADSFTLCTWVKLRGKPTGNHFIVAKEFHGPPDTGYYMLVGPYTSGRPALALHASGSRRTIVKGATNLLDKKWHHVASTSLGNRGAGSDIKLYVDGKQETATVMFDTLGSRSILNDLPLTVGSRQNGAWSAHALIDEVMVFNRALSAREVKRIYDSQK